MNTNESVQQPGAPESPYVPYPLAQPSTNPQGRTSLVMAVAIVVVSTASSVYAWSVPWVQATYGFGPGHVSTIMAILSGIEGLLAIIALATGVSGLRLAGAPKGAAGAGTAIGAWTLLSLLFTWLAPTLVHGF